ncbi:uncharacterized protein ARMOST_20303 [Armillaria ostoyae]|uniref:Uncharacterized protein n=1 Tax=Armillaria ostoyae TaxID=47428 RepID=A0A284S700_ARMOS|nr:uncharacterized protein ARMOST_20303 [Armillaria ostoyae]
MPTNIIIATPLKQRLRMKLKRWKAKLRGYLERPGLVYQAETPSPPESQLVPTPIDSTENVNVVVVNAGSHDLD